VDSVIRVCNLAVLGPIILSHWWLVLHTYILSQK